jgi:hypothetical protein
VRVTGQQFVEEAMLSDLLELAAPRQRIAKGGRAHLVDQGRAKTAKI